MSRGGCLREEFSTVGRTGAQGPVPERRRLLPSALAGPRPSGRGWERGDARRRRRQLVAGGGSLSRAPAPGPAPR